MSDRPSLHKQLMYMPTVTGTILFVMAALNLSGLMNLVGTIVLLFVTAVPFQYSYSSLFPIEPSRLREAKILPSFLLFATQVVFWVLLFVVASRVGESHVT